MWDSMSGTRVPGLDIWHSTDRQRIQDSISETWILGHDIWNSIKSGTTGYLALGLQDSMSGT
jgi:hypothetical protein